MSARRFSLSRLARSLFPRRHSPGRKLAARRAFLEQLERRDLLAQVSSNAYDLLTPEVNETDPAIWRISRTPPEPTTLTVNFTLWGTARWGADYYPLNQLYVTFNPGEWEKLVYVQAKDDPYWEGTESVNLTITPSPNYTIGNQTSAIMVISDDGMGLLDPYDANMFGCSCSTCTCPPPAEKTKKGDNRHQLGHQRIGRRQKQLQCRQRASRRHGQRHIHRCCPVGHLHRSQHQAQQR